jgi:DNA-binding NarL/FixJ family response regulator
MALGCKCEAASEGATANARVWRRDAPEKPIVTVEASDSVRRTRPIRVLLVGREVMVREGLRRLLVAETGIQVVGEASSTEQAASMARQLAPDVFVADLGSLDPGAAGPMVTALRDGGAEARIVLLGGEIERSRPDLPPAGTHGFVSKTASSRELLTAVRMVYAGQRYLHLGEIDRRSADASVAEALTERERAVLRLIAQGRTTAEVAAQLSITRRTVQFHLRQVFGKLDATSRIEAVHLARQRGWIP